MLILLVLLIFFAALGIPLAFAIGASCVTYILIYAPTFIAMLPQRVWNGAYSELMIAMPLFMQWRRKATRRKLLPVSRWHPLPWA